MLIDIPKYLEILKIGAKLTAWTINYASIPPCVLRFQNIWNANKHERNQLFNFVNVSKLSKIFRNLQ